MNFAGYLPIAIMILDGAIQQPLLFCSKNYAV